MAAVPKKVMDAISQYISIISSEISVERVILFGSYAKNTYHKDSDIDIAVFSKDFSGGTKIDDMAYLLLKTSGLGYDIQPIPFTPEEYDDPEGLMEEILRTGIELQVA